MADLTASVSVVIPTFNRAHLLAHTLDSVLAQTCPCEIIVCDHGSTDSTPELMRAYAGKVRYVRREEDFGPIFCWLDGVLHATGDFVHLQYDDDWIKPTYLERCIELLDEDVGFAFSAIEIYDDKRQQVQTEHLRGLFPTGVHRRAVGERLLLENMLSPGAVTLRKQDLIDALYVGRLPTSAATYHGAGPDCFITLLAMMRYPRFAYIDEPLAVFRSHEASITTKALADVARADALAAAYRDVKDHYLLLRYGSRLRFARGVRAYLKLRRILRRVLPV